MIAVLFFLILIRFSTGERLPNPNGYDDFVRAGGMVAGKTSAVNFEDATQVATFAAQNSVVLAQVRAGLNKKCLVPVEFKTGWMGRHTREIMALGEAANALKILAREREAAGAIDEAASIWLDEMRLGMEARRGGVIIDYEVGASTEYWSIKHLHQLVSRLDQTHCQNMLRMLKGLASTVPAWSDVKRQERRWKWLGSGWWQSWDGIKKMVDDVFSGPSVESQTPTSDRLRELSAAQGKLMLALARRAFELEQGRPPANDTELVPRYLLRLP